MSRSTAVVTAALLVIAVVAVGDAVRDEPRRPAAPEARSATTEESTTEPSPTQPRLSGRLVFTDESCSVRVIALPSEERLPTELLGSCGLWGPARTGRIAYGVGDVRPGALTFRLADIDGGPLAGTFHARPGTIVWSPDGAVAWCTPRGVGLALQIRAPPRRLPRCADAYGPEGPVYAAGRTLHVGGDRLATLPGRITGAALAENGTIVAVVGRSRLYVVRARGASVSGPITLPRSLRGTTLVLSPDGCAALVPSLHLGVPPTVSVLDLDCPERVVPTRVQGHAAAWSPGGAWFAVAGERGIDVYPRNGVEPATTIAEFANQVVWKH